MELPKGGFTTTSRKGDHLEDIHNQILGTFEGMRHATARNRGQAQEILIGNLQAGHSPRQDRSDDNFGIVSFLLLGIRTKYSQT